MTEKDKFLIAAFEDKIKMLSQEGGLDQFIDWYESHSQNSFDEELGDICTYYYRRHRPKISFKTFVKEVGKEYLIKTLTAEMHAIMTLNSLFS